MCELAARYEEADTAYERALAEGAPRGTLLRKRGVLAERHGRYDDALALYDEVAAEDDPADRLAAQLARAIVLYRQGSIDDSAATAGPPRRLPPDWPTRPRSPTRTTSVPRRKATGAARRGTSSTSPSLSSRSSVSCTARQPS